MSATPTATYSLHCAATTRQPLTSTRAAAQIFGPELYPLYINWQFDTENPKQAALHPSRPLWRRTKQEVRKEGVGGMPSAQTFKAFMNTRRVKKQLYMQDAEDYPTDEDGEGEEERKEGAPGPLTTRLCNHSVHPGNPWMTTDICPVCLISQCIASLERIAHVWRLVGGPLKPYRSEATRVSQIDAETSMIYHEAKRLWHAEKGRWANLVSIYEYYAKDERSWEEVSQQDGLTIPHSVNESSSCMKALELATQTPLLAEGWSATFIPKRRLRQRSVGDELQLSYGDGDPGAEIPYLPPDSLQSGPEMSWASEEASNREEETCDATAHHVDRANTIELSPDNLTIPPRSPPSSASSSSIYAPSPPSRPPSSPTKTLPQYHLPPPISGVSFSNSLPSPSSRQSFYYQRSSPSYKPGQHASPFGSPWADTSFMSDSKYDTSGIDESEDEELDRLMREPDESSQDSRKMGERESPDITNVDLDLESKEEEDENDWSDDSDIRNDGNDEGDLIVHTGRKYVRQKRLPGQIMGLSIQRPVFSFSWPQHPAPKETDEADKDAMSDEFDDEQAEQAMQDIVTKTMESPTDPAANTDTLTVASGGAEEMVMGPLVEPETQISHRRRSHDEFNEIEETEKEDHGKRHCH